MNELDNIDISKLTPRQACGLLEDFFTCVAYDCTKYNINRVRELLDKIEEMAKE